VIGHDLTTWTAGYQAGHRRGHQDGIAETVGRCTRDPSHQGHAGEPPGDDPEWVDGFLDGYAHGREEAMGGAGHVAP
jgi:hypothetical protein